MMLQGDQAQLWRSRLERHLLGSKGTKLKLILLHLARYETPFGFLVALTFKDAHQSSLVRLSRRRIQFNLSMCKINRQEIWPLRPNSLLFKRVPASVRVSSSR